MQEIQLTLWKSKSEVLNTEYGMITYYAWCLKEQKRIPNTFMVTRPSKTLQGDVEVCLKKRISDEEFKTRNFGTLYITAEGNQNE